MTFKAFSGILLCLAMGFGFVSRSHSIQADADRSVQSMALKAGVPMPPPPIAVYQKIKIEDLNKLLIDSFSEFNFSLLGVQKMAYGLKEFEFSYPIGKGDRSNSVVFKFLVDGSLMDGKCMNCFLREGRLQNLEVFEKLSWMAQYELKSRLHADIDKAYLSLKNRSQPYMDRSSQFNYVNMAAGQRNRLTESNSYVGVKLPDLKRDVTRAMTDAGFTLLRDNNPGAGAADSSLVFLFPIGSSKTDGAIYAIRFTSQFDADGFCYPCETTQVYDPYQTLPSPGFFGMPGRATLASRFETGFTSAYDGIKASTERYLRPGTQFVRPVQPLPPGSTRPQTPMVVT
jgi:hypothetical protein